MEIADNSVLKVLERTLNVASRRASLVATNVANVDTPGYKAKTFDFDAALAACGEDRMGGMEPVRTDPMHISSNGRSRSTSVAINEATDSSPGRYDGNTVNVESEMADLLEAELMFSASSRLALKKIEMLKSAIS
ncbi:MAG: flagellar basal body rod protein FlgB [Candidatus Coatesbacteria bacterium]|nr:flagellar basal body rod protein FlgB [Candidatus Coatesbacteria bacterium]